jgi:hypothetical protein
LIRSTFFEANKTKIKRVLINLVIFVLFASATITTMCFYLPHYGEKESTRTQSSLYKRSPDLIAIYTGGAGRIAFGLEVSKKYPNAKVFISGVYNKNTVETLIEKQVKPNKEIAEKKLENTPLEGSDNSVPQSPFELIDIDYQAKSTVENVIYTLHYLRERNEHKNILIVSSDYHIFRIKWLVNSLLSKNDGYEFSYLGMKTNFSSWKSIRILIRETFKLAQTYVFLAVWDKEEISEIPN